MDLDREARQLRLMLARLDHYDRGECSLGDLVADLEGLLHALERAPDAWREAFQQAWNDLEVSLAMATFHRSIGQLPADDSVVLQRSIAEIRELVRRRIEDGGQAPPINH